MKLVSSAVLAVICLVGCTHKKSDNAGETCADRDMQSLAATYTLGGKDQINCMAVNKVEDTDSHAIQLSLGKAQDKIWPRYFIIWSGSAQPVVNKVYKKSGDDNGFYGMSYSTVRDPKEPEIPVLSEISTEFSAIAAHPGDLTQGVLRVTQSGVLTEIPFNITTTVETE
jgi:hypothetical protein